MHPSRRPSDWLWISNTKTVPVDATPTASFACRTQLRGLVDPLHERHERVESAEPETQTRWLDQALIADNFNELLR
jgi:hypothetical protein